MGSSLFSRSTAVEPLGNGRYEGELSETWNCPTVPQGGIASAVAARAMTAELNHPEQTLRSISVVFVGPVAHGPFVVDVTVLRRGRSMSQMLATMRNPDAQAGLTAIAVFGAEREGFAFTDAVPPDGVGSPSDYPAFREIEPPDGFEDHEPFNFWTNVEGKPVIGHPPWEDYDPVTSLTAKWSRFVDVPRADDGTWDPLAVLALSDTMPSAAFERIGSDANDRPVFPPSADFTVHLFGDARCEWLLQVNRARRAWDGYASVDMETWDMDGEQPHLVAYATQVMFFAFQ